jgi:hypothetical protein
VSKEDKDPGNGESTPAKKMRWRIVSPLKRGGVVHQVDAVIELTAEEADDVPDGVLKQA